MDDRTRHTFTVGRMWARHIRRGLLDWGLDFTEDKGWLDSHFVVTGEASRIRSFLEAVQRWQQQTVTG